jgi:hypothetical protein
MATRVALGANRLQLVRPVLIESVLLSSGAAVLGIPLAYWLLRVVTQLAPADLPRMQEVGVSVPLLGGAVALSLLIGLVAGLVPAWRLANRSDRLETTVHQRSSASTSSAARGGVAGGRLLVMAEIALAVMLLAAAGLLVRSFAVLTHVDVGFDAGAVTTFQVVAPPGREANRAEFYGDLLRRLGSLPGVEAAGVTDVLPIAGASGYHFVLPGLPVDPGPGDPMLMRLVSRDYFRAMGIRIVAGQSFADAAVSRRQVVIPSAPSSVPARTPMRSSASSPTCGTTASAAASSPSTTWTFSSRGSLRRSAHSSSSRASARRPNSFPRCAR